MHARLHRDEAGIALVSALLVLLLMSSLAVGFMALAAADTRTRALSGARTQAFYAAHAGLEQLTADLGDLFSANFAATCADVEALAATPPELPGVTWSDPDGGSGYQIVIESGCDDDVPVALTKHITGGPFQGFIGLATDYRMAVTAHQIGGPEASLERRLQTVAIPVFQFGMFSETDLSFFAGPSFNFGGRVHTNGNLFLAADPGPLTMSDRVTAVGEIIRAELSNQLSTASSHSGDVRVLTSPGAYRALARNEGSKTGGLDSTNNEPAWTNLSTGAYNSYIVNGRTGARRLELPLTSFGAEAIDLIRRPVAGEDGSAPSLLSQRFFSMASLRILLSDSASEITSLPTVTADAPIDLTNLAAAIARGYSWSLNSPRPGFAVSSGTANQGARTPAGTPLLDGFLKIEMQTQAGSWQDVTIEILNQGIGGRQLLAPAWGCAEVSPDAIIRIQRLSDNGPACLNPVMTAANFWPMALYDPREGLVRDGQSDTSPPRFGGVMHYIELDVRNLSRWFQGVIGTSGTNAIDTTGYVVYFSDRRGNKNGGAETGEYGVEDFVNRASGGGAAAGLPDGLLEAATATNPSPEDVNGNGALDMYGAVPRLPASVLHVGTPLGANQNIFRAANAANIRPWLAIDENNDGVSNQQDSEIARANRPVFFRRALKLTNGGLGDIVAPGLTVASENPVYVQGNWNASGAGFGDPHVATAVIADAVTLLSNNWNDRVSFLDPHNVADRPAATTWYRLAVIGGKGLSFTRITGANADFGTDGGAHNFLRLIENWSNGSTLNYRGAIASMYLSRQAVGTYKCCIDVYGAPTRAFAFDTDFLTPALLPPRTPMFRDVNTTGFAQIVRPR
jgi:hypothetical protein